ncbi:MAG TPA: type II secretion system protein [Patescibacteria group bacterium]
MNLMVKRNGGFTLIELLLVIAIIGILSAIGLVSFAASLNRGRDAQRKSDISNLVKALEQFRGDWGVYPDAGTNNEIMGCMQLPNDVNFSACPDSGKFHYFRNLEDIVLLSSYPVDPSVNRFYRYEHTAATGSNDEGFALYAALENTNDKDTKKDINGVSTDWGVSCGLNGASTPLCNYKVTESGLTIK